ncbi:UrcA family protein [Aurantiacibacter odishensis]|uniref:UrcA family protein n=1 Tax=Aurantiacibacter odishensis TaxID=1155476 RepID=UPI0013C46DAF|nr:UrcA family protein [Aurantiacibacter odishensis]
MKTISIKASLAAALVAGATVGAPAFAEEGELVTVSYNDLNLATPGGIAALDRRIDRAAMRVCGIKRHMAHRQLPTSQQRTCYRETLDKLEREVALIVDRRRGAG